MRVLTVRYQGDWEPPLDPSLDGEQTLVLAFGAVSQFQSGGAFAALRATYPRAHWLACSTAGEICDGRVSDESVVAAIIRFEHTRLVTATTQVNHQDESRRGGQAIGRQLVAPDLRAIFVLSQGHAVNGSELVDGIRDGAGFNVPITGGLAGDGPRFRQTWVYGGDKRGPGTVAAVGLYGDRLHFGHGHKGGWALFGLERRVTRSAGNVLYELDGIPALGLYKRYLGELVSGLPATALLFPLAVRDATTGESVVRTILSIDEANQSMTFAGTIPEGSFATLMQANFERLIQGAFDAGNMALAQKTPGGALLTIAISCVGRRMLLGSRSEEETEAALEMFPKGTGQIGFYSYGEIAPHASGRCDLHNQTMTITLLGET